MLYRPRRFTSHSTGCIVNNHKLLVAADADGIVEMRVCLLFIDWQGGRVEVTQMPTNFQSSELAWLAIYIHTYVFLRAERRFVTAVVADNSHCVLR